MRIRFVLTLLGAIGVSSLFFASACSNQGEGDLCSRLADNNGSDDCQSNLVCTTIFSTPNGDRCCPADPNLATTAVCRRPAAGTADAAPPPATTADAGTLDANVTVDSGDGTPDSSLDAADATDS